MDSIAENEELNDASEKAIKNLSIKIVHLADVKESQMSKIDEKVITDLAAYEGICRNAKEEIKALATTRSDLNKRRSSEFSKKLRHQGFIESDHMASNVQIAKISRELQTVGESFEKQKLAEMKEILTNFILIQIKSCTSSLEILTEAFKDVHEIDVNKDLEQFKKHLQQHEGIRASHTVTFGKALSILSQSASNLDRLGRRAKSALKTKTTRRGRSSMSLDSLSSHSSDVQEVRKESKIIEVQLTENEEETTSDESEDTDLEDSTTETEEATDTNENQFPKPAIRIEHAI